jgi:hypothetical protein
MNEIAKKDAGRKRFIKNLPHRMTVGKGNAENLLLREYGSVFVARGGVVPPDRVVFRDEAEVTQFQNGLQISKEAIGGFEMELQSPAMAALFKAVDEASKDGLTITPRGADSARRNYTQTIELWASRVEPALDHWLNQGRVAKEKADHIRSLTPFEQVPEVLELESQGIWFAKDLSKSIIYSVAPPGTSQHLSLLAFDVREFGDAKVRAILAATGWFRTVASDLPHFTYLGMPENELSRSGLQEVYVGEDSFWIPDL